MRSRLWPDKYNDELVDEYWASWQRKLDRLGLGISSLSTS